MNDNLETLAKRADELRIQAQNIAVTASEEKRQLTEDEQKEIRECLEVVDSINAEMELRKRLAASSAKTDELIADPVARKTEPTQPAKPEGAPEVLAAGPANSNQPTIRVGQDRARQNPKGGYLSFGDFLRDIVVAGQQKSAGIVPPKLQALAAASTYGSTAVGADGGFAIPQDFSSGILNAVMGEESLLSRCSLYRLTGNSLKIPSDETTPWGTSGMQAYWTSEASAITQSKPALKNIELNLNKLSMLVALTEELLDDANALQSHVNRKAPEIFTSKINHAIVQGSGSGQPLGFFTSAAKVSVAQATSQVADTIWPENIYSMWARMLPANRRNAIWVIHPSVEGSLPLMGAVVYNGTTPVGGGVPLYQPPGMMSSTPNAPNGTLLGRPLFVTEACETLGDNGDICLIDPIAYAIALKASGVTQLASPHLWFDQDIMALKFTLRIDGQPTWSTTVSPRDGSATYSPFITLDTRAG